MKFIEELAGRRRFGMKPGLDAMRRVCAALGNPESCLAAIHVAGTNGKGAVCAMLDSCLRAAGLRIGRYTSPHLVRIVERFFLAGHPVDDALLEASAARIGALPSAAELTYFEALTAVAFDLYAAARPDYLVLETGLGGRLDATNVCRPAITAITRIGLDHCDWLGTTLPAIAAEKAGIVKPGVPVVLGENVREVREVVRRRAAEVGAPFVYAPEIVSPDEIAPDALSLGGSFNRENAVTALAVLKTLSPTCATPRALEGLKRVVWPGRFQRVGSFVVDGAHNPPAARALAAALDASGLRRMNLVAGFCGDKDVGATLRLLAPFVARGFAVKTQNPRSLSAEAVAREMRAAGISASACVSLKEAIALASGAPTLVCGSLFLAGEALVALGAYPWGDAACMDPAEQLEASGS